MSKKKAVTPKTENLKGSIETPVSTNAEEEAAWSEKKKKASSLAKKADFDVERILFGCSIEGQVTIHLHRVIEMLDRPPYRSQELNTLGLLGECLARRLSQAFQVDVDIKDESLELALSFLYLFPKLWKTLDKSLSANELRALDFDELLSERRRRRPPKT